MWKAKIKKSSRIFILDITSKRRQILCNTWLNILRKPPSSIMNNTKIPIRISYKTSPSTPMNQNVTITSPNLHLPKKHQALGKTLKIKIFIKAWNIKKLNNLIDPPKVVKPFLVPSLTSRINKLALDTILMELHPRSDLRILLLNNIL